MAIPAKVKPLGEYDKYIRMMLVADAGFGKTVFGGTAPNCLFLTTDPEGTISARMQGSTALEWKIEDYDELMEAYKYLRDGGIEELGLEWLVIDNTTEAQNLAMLVTMQLARARNKNLDEFISSQQDYLRSQNMVKQLVKQFNDLPVNILWTSWQNRYEDGEGTAFYGPAIHGQQGALAQTIAGYMNIVGYGQVLEEDGDEFRRIWFSHSDMFRGKDRFAVLGKYRDDLDVPTLQRIIKSAINKANSKSTTTKAPARVAAKKPVARKPLAAKK